MVVSTSYGAAGVGSNQREAGSGKREEGRGKREAGRGKRDVSHLPTIGARAKGPRCVIVCATLAPTPISIFPILIGAFVVVALAVAYVLFGPKLPKPRRKPARVGDFGPAFWGATGAAAADESTRDNHGSLASPDVSDSTSAGDSGGAGGGGSN